MRFLNIMGNSFGCSASGERLVSAARDGDFLEAKALLECNPRLARYYTFGVRNSPLHYSAAQGHHEIVSLLLESGVDINLRNLRGQTALMQACQFGHWEVVQILMLFKANIHRTDYINGGTALHYAALNGHSRCIRLILVDYVPSIPSFWNTIRRSNIDDSISDFDESSLLEVVNKKADGGITALHMAALNRHVESMQLLLDLGASVSEVTVEDGTTMDLIGAGSTPLHYAAYGGNAVCCEVLIARGASLTAENINGGPAFFDLCDLGFLNTFRMFSTEYEAFNKQLICIRWTPLVVARSWDRNWLEGILSRQESSSFRILPSPYLSLPLMSIMKIAREHEWKGASQCYPSFDPCAVCLERNCNVSAEGCSHEFCTKCALYLCSTSTTSATISGPPGSIPCPLCRNAIISFLSLSSGSPVREPSKTSLSLSLCATCPAVGSESDGTRSIQLCPPDFGCTGIPPLGSASFRSLSCQRFQSARQSSSLICMGTPETSPALVRCSRSGLSRSASHRDNGGRRPWVFAAN